LLAVSFLSPSFFKEIVLLDVKFLAGSLQEFEYIVTLTPVSIVSDEKSAIKLIVDVL
jgi:hypothetical protein